MATILLVLTVAVILAVVVTPRRGGARHRRRRRAAAALDWIRAIRAPASTLTAAQEQRVAVQDCDGETQDCDGETHDATVDQTLGVRLLRNKVRDLEEALEREQLSTANLQGAADFEVYGRRVGTVIRALGANLESAEMPQALARVSAGIDRLVVREHFARPVLTVARDRPAAPMVDCADAPAVLSDGPAGAPTTEVIDAEAAEPTPVEPLAETPVTPEIVLPVPPTAPVASNRRSRWFIRSRAA